MPEDQAQDQISFLLSDFNARLRDTEEKNKVLKERTVILGNNLLAIKDNLDKSVFELKKDVSSMKRDIENIKNLLENFVNESNSFVRKDEVALVERMLKDFFPLDFARSKDMKDYVEERLSEIKKTSPNKENDKELKRFENIINEEIKEIKEKIDKNIKEIKEIIKEQPKEKEKQSFMRPVIEHKILSSERVPTEENKKLHEHINQMMSHLNNTPSAFIPNKSKKAKRLK